MKKVMSDALRATIAGTVARRVQGSRHAARRHAPRALCQAPGSASYPFSSTAARARTVPAWLSRSRFSRSASDGRCSMTTSCRPISSARCAIARSVARDLSFWRADVSVLDPLFEARASTSTRRLRQSCGAWLAERVHASLGLTDNGGSGWRSIVRVAGDRRDSPIFLPHVIEPLMLLLTATTHAPALLDSPPVAPVLLVVGLIIASRMCHWQQHDDLADAVLPWLVLAAEAVSLLVLMAVVSRSASASTRWLASVAREHAAQRAPAWLLVALSSACSTLCARAVVSWIPDLWRRGSRRRHRPAMLALPWSRSSLL